MKKTLALILAAMMVAVTASVAFADASASVVFADDADIEVFVADEDADNEDDAALVSMQEKENKKDIEWGDSLYLELKVEPASGKTEKEEVARYRAKADWAVGADLVTGLDIVYKKVKDTDDYKYFVEIKTKENVTTSSQDLEGTVKVFRGSSSNLEDDQEFKLKIEKFKTAKYPSIKFVSSNAGDGETEDYVVYEIGNDDAGNDYAEVIKFEEDLGEITIEFDGTGEFDVDIAGEQSKQYLGFDRKANSDILNKYDYAELEFVNFPGKPTFNKTGVMYLYTDVEDAYVYALNDGKLEAVKAAYDEEREAVKFAARNFASTYVISDTELEIVNDSTDTEGETTPSDTVKPNPGTGR